MDRWMDGWMDEGKQRGREKERLTRLSCDVSINKENDVCGSTTNGTRKTVEKVKNESTVLTERKREFVC